MASNQPPDPNVGRLPVDLRPRRLILLPYNDLGINQGLDQFLPIDPKGFSLTLGMVYGLGPNEPRVLRTDDSGNLLVAGAAGAAPAPVRLQDGAGTTLASVIPFNGLTDTAVGLVPTAIAVNDGQGGARGWRPASAFILATQLSNNAGLVAPPGQWAVQHSPAVSVVATVTKPAGGAGVRNVCNGVSFGFSSGVAVAATTMQVNLRDGATGAGTILMSWIYDLAAAIIVPFTVEETGFEIVGSAATAMTLEFTAALANLHEFVNLNGHTAS